MIYLVGYEDTKPWGLFDNKDKAIEFYEYLKNNSLPEYKVTFEEKKILIK